MWLLVAVSAATLTMFGFVPQIIKVLKTKSAHDVSVMTLLQFSIGVSLWAFYGIHLKDIVIIVANIITLITLIVLLLLYQRFK